jgi:rubrerythrin
MNYSKSRDFMNRNKNELPKTYKSLEQALSLAKQAVQGEREDELFYDYLISVAPSDEEVEIIESIRDDERKHNKMFKAIYKYYTGEEIETSMDIDFEEPRSFIDGVKKAFFGELSAMERYRIIRAGLPDRYFRDMVFEILTDEMKHATKYNYILNLNLERMVMGHHMDNMCMPMKQQMNMGMMGMPMDMNCYDDMDMDDRYMYRADSERTPDEWVAYIEPLVKRAQEEMAEGINMYHLFQEFILSGVLVGLGLTPKEAIDKVELWETTGESQLLKQSKMQRYR